VNRPDIVDIVRQELAVAAPGVARDAAESASLKHDLDVDSLAIIELVARLEYRFTVSVPDDVWPQLGSIAAIADYIASTLVTS
jgi:acyl carrier protein